ncbi:MAG TPA: hypothetical protein PL155_04670 [Candidatus Omnitrophota bacterium]|nr:hypothetical protein [Candidatus Omnitrophota bacterium]HPD84229.1 hypothetical protein [Candidatus Omnitrophota bacterium]HRZ03085.1 hypothetical protein [Candidatus Omnitrophota bacterium]
MPEKIFLTPPVAFIVVLLVIASLSYLFSKLSFRDPKHGKDERKPYACGEDFDGSMIQPDYSQFFPFAFFFTILHVVALMITTVPAGVSGTLAMAVIYIISAVVGLFILLGK